ncbi:putative protein DUF1745 [Clostridium aceticum]|uniref:Uncharacterized protein n=1 Tax=Clostridium aceticum TaxID=84022 RepID=A0A0D8IE65_9CLOT|nr:SEC-C metal-binding domain-containing protein [Clostridium aceticum]AKL94420.1 putative protein DUF1745 [Clostridium aceticum]KJF28354.1 hypothetical protein TZ02_03030 [Clostridium aceticum]
MREKTGEKIETVLLQAMDDMKRDMEKRQIKRESTLWRKINFPYTFKEMLMSLTKNELTEIRQNLKIQGVSGFKKQPLVEVLNEKMFEDFPMVLWNLDRGRFELVKKVVANNGALYNTYLRKHQVEYYRSRGLVFSGTIEDKKVLTTPKEFEEALRSIENNQEVLDKLERNEKWIRLTYGLLYYYGVLDIHILIPMLEELANCSIIVPEYLEVIEDSIDYYRQIIRVDGGYCHKKVSDVEKLKEEQRQRTDLNYYPFSYDEIYEAGGIGFVDRNDAYERMMKLIKDHYNIMPNEAGSLVEECIYAIRTGESINNIAQFIQRHLEVPNFETMKRFTEEIIYLNNNTRQWMIKGYTPEELAQREKPHLMPTSSAGNGEVFNIKTKKKIGRNDPCPCGSGKKYKKCCG